MKQRIGRVVLFFIAIFLLSLTAAAATADKALYSIVVPVSSQSAADLQKALPQALGQVLAQVSGDANIVHSSQVQQQLPHASTIVQSYSYQTNSADSSTSLGLKVQFDPQAIGKILQQTGHAVQATLEYPPLLVWLATPAGQTHVIIGNNAQDATVSALNNAAQQNHMSLMLPLLDLDDLNAINAEQVWQLDTQAVTAASQRYAITNILAGRLESIANGQWQSQWSLLSQQRSWQWHITAATPQAVLQKVLANVAQILVKPVVTAPVNPATTTVIKVHVSEVTGLDQFSSVVKFFRNLAPVSHAEVSDIAGDNIVLDISVNGDATILTKAIQDSQMLLPDSSNSNTSNALYYRWLSSTN